MPMPGGQPEGAGGGGWAQVELIDALVYLVCYCVLYKALTIECTQLLCWCILPRGLYSLVRFRLLIRYSKKATELGQFKTPSKKQHW